MPALYLDCDGFFAACEEAADPALYGRPVGVSTIDPDEGGAVLIAVNVPAKRAGLAKGMPVRDARGAVPALAVRHQRPELYVATHRAILDATATVVENAATRSIDEVSGEVRADDDPGQILTEVKRALRAAVGPRVTASAAIAPSAYLAKTAAEAHKPDGAVTWGKDDLPCAYEGLPLDALPGLGPATERRLRAHRIDTVTALYHTERAFVRTAWGSVVGLDVHEALHGGDPRPRTRPRARLSHGRVLEPALRSWTLARPIMRFITTCIVHRCRREHVAPKQMALDAADTAGATWALAARIAPDNDERRALGTASGLWDALAARASAPPKRFALTAAQLVAWPARQGDLFRTAPDPTQALVERVRGRFGARAITYGWGLDRTGTYTGVKIAFEHVPDAEDFEWIGIEMPPVPGGA